MRKIEKGREPAAWTARRMTPGAVYEAVPELREALLREQGHICAYCMGRIPAKDMDGRVSSRIEHVLCRGVHPELQLDYNNMVLCCPGDLNNVAHCDRSKGNRDVSFSLFDQGFIDSLSYDAKGAIKCSDSRFQSEIDEVLNLNHPLLKENRRVVLDQVKMELGRKWTPKQLKRILRRWDSKDSEGRFKSYCGVVAWYIKKKLSAQSVK